MTSADPLKRDCPLSERELQVIVRVAQGDSNSEIGRDLRLSPLTIKTHLARIATKLDEVPRSRAAIVAICLRRGWIV